MEATSRIECPHCATALDAPATELGVTCPGCGEHLDIVALEIFLRSREMFLQAREQTPIPLKSKRAPLYRPLPDHVTRIYQQAYSGLERAFAGQLIERHRKEGIEMMAETSLIFAQNARVSGVEANYWKRLMMEQVALDELEEIDAKLSDSNASHGLKRLHWRLRRMQLLRSLTKIDQKIADVEDILKRIAPLHARAKR